MPGSHARVPTSRASRYLKQLCSHFDHKADSTYDDHKGHTVFAFGECTMLAEPEALLIEVSAADTEQLARVKYVVGDHLERFSKREGLSVDWRE
ncbi:MAG: DUF2218 domain-containing protein [Stackebrandtia sp.]